jgi:chemotaxis protein MotA
MDLVTLLGLFLAIGGILGGQMLEGGHVSSLIQGTAFIIVFGGTLGAVLVSTTREDLITGLRLLKLGFRDHKGDDPEKIVGELIDAAQIARKESILALERKLSTFSNPFMQNVFRFVIDGVDPGTLRDIFESEIYMEEDNLNAGARIWTDAGGFSPTIGIIGAVLGLIHVMENLADTSKLGAGIAVAFVATVYGVASANIFFLPMGNKIKRKIKMQLEVKVMVLEGAIGIMSGMNPFIIEEKLRSYIPNGKKSAARE